MPGNYSHTTRAPGLILTASIYNADHQNHVDNTTPDGVDDASADLSAYRTTADPGEAGSESIPASLRGEIQRLRKLIAEIVGKTQWYESPVTDLGSLMADKANKARLDLEFAVVDLGAGSGTRTVDLDTGRLFTATVETSANTFEFINPEATGATSFVLELTNGGSQTVTLPASVKWSGGVAPSLAAEGVDLLQFVTIDAGTTWYGLPVGLGMA